MCPHTMANWYISPRRPRLVGGATSAMYIGDAIEHNPTPNPPTARKMLKIVMIDRSLGPDSI